MAPTLTKVVLVGASGTVGSHIVDALLADSVGDFTITILSRQDSSSSYPNHPAITIVKSDYTISGLVSTFKGHDAIIHAAGLASLTTQPLLIEAAIQARIPRFILNEFANSPLNQVGLPELERFRTTKKEVMALAQRAAQEHPTFSWSALATGNFLDYSLKKFPQFGIDIRARKARLVDDGSERFSAVVLRDIGIAIRGILRRPDETRNKLLHIRSVETCQREILDILRQELGGEWEVSSESSQVMYERGRELFAKGEKRGQMELLVVQLFAKGGRRSIVVTRGESDNALLGVEEKDVRSIVKDVLSTFDQVDGSSKQFDSKAPDSK